MSHTWVLTSSATAYESTPLVYHRPDGVSGQVTFYKWLCGHWENMKCHYIGGQWKTSARLDDDRGGTEKWEDIKCITWKKTTNKVRGRWGVYSEGCSQIEGHPQSSYTKVPTLEGSTVPRRHSGSPKLNSMRLYEGEKTWHTQFC